MERGNPAPKTGAGPCAETPLPNTARTRTLPRKIDTCRVDARGSAPRRRRRWSRPLVAMRKENQEPGPTHNASRMPRPTHRIVARLGDGAVPRRPSAREVFSAPPA